MRHAPRHAYIVHADSPHTVSYTPECQASLRSTILQAKVPCHAELYDTVLVTIHDTVTAVHLPSGPFDEGVPALGLGPGSIAEVNQHPLASVQAVHNVALVQVLVHNVMVMCPQQGGRQP